MPEFDPDARFIDYVLPVFEITEDPSGEGARFERFRGTCFLIGSRGMALTAAHVVRDPQDTLAVAVRDPAGDGWRIRVITHAEEHATEDVAVVRIHDCDCASFLHPASGGVWPSADWYLFGYPEDVMNELVRDESVVYRPDLVYVAGYVRRRMTSIPVPVIRGRSLYELSGVAGAGCSGSPVIHRIPREHDQSLLVVGIYLGEHLAPDRGLLVSYAARLDAVVDWHPQLLGHALRYETDFAPPPAS